VPHLQSRGHRETQSLPVVRFPLSRIQNRSARYGWADRTSRAVRKPHAPTHRNDRIMNEGWLCPEDIARVVGHTPRTIQRWCREKRIPHMRVGRLYRFAPAQLREIEALYAVEATVEVAAANAPNPDYSPSMVVVPIDPRMRRPA
jgi:excisionase family DNA binding protein